MVAAAAALIVFRLIRQPPILGYILAGVLVGPFALEGKFVQDTETVSLVADVGLVVLLFAIGVEFGWERIRKVGLRVIVIGAIEIAAMMSLGYFLGRALGWTSTTSVYLGAALSFSSSAVLVGYLRGSGQLTSLRGQLVVGVLVVEDFAAVVLLAVLAGYANHDSGDAVEIWPIVIKMAVFAIGALVFGTLLAPRLMDLLDYLKSRETLLIGSLGACFGVGLLAREMGLSAGAGAFLIGTVLGDTRHRDQIARFITPVRDVFAALFFVSVGMLVNMAEIPEFFGSALIVTATLIIGKVMAATLGTLITGHDGETALKVGTAMPQPGEFSLAIARAGSEHAAVGAQLYPVVTISTLLSSLIYPPLFRAHTVVGLVFRRLTPTIVKRHAVAFAPAIANARRTISPNTPRPLGILIPMRSVIASSGIIALMALAGVLISNVGTNVADEMGVESDLLNVAVLAVVVTLAVPAGIALWKALSELCRLLAHRVFIQFNLNHKLWVAQVISVGVVMPILAVASIWVVKHLLELLALGGIRSPTSTITVVLSVSVAATFAMKIHTHMDKTFRRTLLGDGPIVGSGETKSGED